MSVTVVPFSNPQLICQRGEYGSTQQRDFRSNDRPQHLVDPHPQAQAYLATHLPLPEAVLEQEFRTFLEAPPLLAGELGQRMVTRFMRGGGEGWRHEPGSELSSMAARSATFRNALNAVQAQLHQQVMAQKNAGHIDYTRLRINPDAIPVISFTFADGSMLKALIGGTQALKVTIRSFEVTPQATGYSATLRFEMYDNFGVDESDLYAPPLAAFYVLQHWHENHRPFVNNVVVDQSIAGAL